MDASQKVSLSYGLSLWKDIMKGWEDFAGDATWLAGQSQLMKLWSNVWSGVDKN